MLSYINGRPSYHCDHLLFKSTVGEHCNVLDGSFIYSVNLWFKTGGKIFSVIQILECLYIASLSIPFSAIKCQSQIVERVLSGTDLF